MATVIEGKDKLTGIPAKVLNSHHERIGWASSCIDSDALFRTRSYTQVPNKQRHMQIDTRADVYTACATWPNGTNSCPYPSYNSSYRVI